MRRTLIPAVLLLLATLLVAAAAFATAALADPSHNIQAPETLTCSNGTTVVVNPGTLKNQSHEGFASSARPASWWSTTSPSPTARGRPSSLIPRPL